MATPPPTSLTPIFHPSPARGERQPTRRSPSPSTQREPSSMGMPPPGASMFEEPAERAPAPVTRTLDVIDTPLYEDTWVTVYGFPCEHSNVVSAVLQEFQACGNLQRWCPGPTSNCNWLHLQFETRHGAQRALHRNGLRLGALNLLLGVQPPSAQDRRHIAQRSDTQWGASAMQPSAVPVRSYVLDSSTKMAPVPQPQRRWTQHAAEFLFGS